MQWPPCATGPTSTSYSSPISESPVCESPVCESSAGDEVDSFCMRGWLQRSKENGRTTTHKSTWVVSGRLPLAGTESQLLLLGSLDLRSTGPRRTDPGAFHSARFLARFFAASEDSSWYGTDVTITPGVNSSRPLRRRALWLCSRCSYQCPTTYSGM